MRVDTRPRKRNAPRIAEKSAPGFLQWLRGRSCIFAFLAGDCGGKIEAMHLDFAGGKGVGTKVADQYAVSSCAKHHALQHSLGWDTFCKRTGIYKDSLLVAANHFWRTWPGRAAWERKLEAQDG
jgi:hypothetical protein